MKSNRSRFTSVLFNIYCSMVQYINDLSIHPAIALMVMSFQTLCMVLQHLRSSGSYAIISFLEYFGIFKLFASQFGNNPALLLIFSIIALAHLLLIVVMLCNVLLSVWSTFDVKNSSMALAEDCERTDLLKYIRGYMLVFQHLYVPIVVPTAVYIVQKYTGLAESLCMIVLILIPLVYYLIEYHQLELDHISSYQLARKNFPNNLVDGALVYAHGIILVALQTQLSTIITLIIFALRLILSYYLPFYDESMRRIHTFLQACGLIIISAEFVNLFVNEMVTFFLVAFILILMLWKVIFSTKNMDYWRKLNVSESKLQICKKLLQQDHTFAYVFRELLFIERQTSSYRELLLLQVLKKRCMRLETASRGGTKIINTMDLLTYEQKMLIVISNFFIITDRSIGLLKFMQIKDPKCEIFIEQTASTVKLINETKDIILDMLRVNTRSSNVVQLALLLSKKVLNDEDFSKSVQDMTRQQIQSLAQKKQRKRLFNPHSGVIFLSLMEDVGKITKVSKNMKEVLGYTSYDLIGLSINQLMPFSLRAQHNEIITNFLKKYSKKMFRTDPSIRFLAYNKNFHLQEVVINYYFNMSDFSNFQLSGLDKRLSNSHSVVLADLNGNLEGWTEDLGKTLSLDSYTQFDCKCYNIFIMIPALIKYQHQTYQNEKICIETLFFIPRDMRSNSLRIIQTNRKSFHNAALIDRQLIAFDKMLSCDQFASIRMVEVQFEILSFPATHVKFQKINFKKNDQVKNPLAVFELLKQRGGADERRLQGDKQCSVISGQECLKESIMNSTHSLESNKNTTKMKSIADYCFSDKMGNPWLNREDIELMGCSDTKIGSPIVRLTMDFAQDDISISQSHVQGSENDTVSLKDAKNKPASNFKPVLQRTRFKQFIFPLSILFIILVVYDQIDLLLFSKQMTGECNNVRHRNDAFMIFVKNSFNPNLTYVKEFNNGNLINDNEQWMDKYQVNYTIGMETVSINQFYMFNTQIPSMLGRLALTGNFDEMDANFFDVVQRFEDRLVHDHRDWQVKVASLSLNCRIRFGIIAVASLVYVMYLIYVFHHSKQLNKIVEAFFKFQKADLDAKVQKLRDCIIDLEIKCQECYFSQELPNIVKDNELNNVSLTRTVEGGDKEIKQEKISFDITKDRQDRITKRKLFILVVFVSIFLISQIAFLIVYGVLSNNLIQTYSEVPQILDDGSKLYVYPNLQIAQLIREVPGQLMLKYSKILPKVLSNPTQQIPLLLPLLQTAPCGNCTFLYPLLATNFISFYSSFNQIIRQKKNQGDANITELFYSLDIVAERIRKILYVRDTPNLMPTISLYLLGVIIFVLAGHSSQNKMSRETDQLQQFLKYFNEETVMKNKHLSNIVKVTF